MKSKATRLLRILSDIRHAQRCTAIRAARARPKPTRYSWNATIRRPTNATTPNPTTPPRSPLPYRLTSLTSRGTFRAARAAHGRARHRAIHVPEPATAIISPSAHASATRPTPTCRRSALRTTGCSSESMTSEIAAPATKQISPRWPTATTGAHPARSARSSRSARNRPSATRWPRSSRHAAARDRA